MAEEELVAALAVRTAMGSQEATPAAEARMVAEAAMEVLKVAQQALTPCQARNNADGQGAFLGGLVYLGFGLSAGAPDQNIAGTQYACCGRQTRMDYVFFFHDRGEEIQQCEWLVSYLPLPLTARCPFRAETCSVVGPDVSEQRFWCWSAAWSVRSHAQHTRIPA